MKQLCNLDCRNADAGACAENKHSLSLTNACQSDQHVPGSDEHQWDARCLIEVERVWNGDHTCDGSCEEFAVPSVNGIAQNGKLAALILQSGDALHTMSAEVHRRHQDSLPWSKTGHVFAYFDDFAGDITPENVRQLYARQSFADP